MDFPCNPAIGDSVREDEVVGEIETDKTSIPVNSPAAGVIEQLLVEDGSTVQPGMDIFKLRVGAAGGSAPAPAATAAATPSPPKVTKEATPAATPQPVPVSQNPAPEKPAPAPSAGQAGDTVPAYGEQRVKMNRMRLRIAQRLKDAQNIYAMLTTFNEIDMT